MVGTALALEHARSLGDAAAIAALEALEPPPFLKATLEEFWAWEIRDLGRTFAVPVFVFQGENDFNTPVSCAREWVGEIRAPADIADDSTVQAIGTSCPGSPVHSRSDPPISRDRCAPLRD
ncbi:MAG: hypothetical protein U1F35_17090 [Steroidobacteraceae bacterium]